MKNIFIFLFLLSFASSAQKKDSIILTHFQKETLAEFESTRTKIVDQAQAQLKEIDIASAWFMKAVLDSWAQWNKGRAITDADSLVLSDDRKKILILKKKIK